MRTEIMYATECALTVYFTDNNEFASADWREHFYSLANAIKSAELIISGESEIARITIWDAKTGEILAECYPDTDEDEDDYSDWDYNEDMGFDPYMGCYTDDC